MLGAVFIELAVAARLYPSHKRPKHLAAVKLAIRPMLQAMSWMAWQCSGKQAAQLQAVLAALPDTEQASKRASCCIACCIPSTNTG